MSPIVATTRATDSQAVAPIKCPSAAKETIFLAPREV
jgi:hypothetical protein